MGAAKEDGGISDSNVPCLCFWLTHILPPFIQMKDGDLTTPDLQVRGAGFSFSEAQILFLSNKDREVLELHIKKSVN